MKALYLY